MDGPTGVNSDTPDSSPCSGHPQCWLPTMSIQKVFLSHCEQPFPDGHACSPPFSPCCLGLSRTHERTETVNAHNPGIAALLMGLQSWGESLSLLGLFLACRKGNYNWFLGYPKFLKALLIGSSPHGRFWWQQGTKGCPASCSNLSAVKTSLDFGREIQLGT